MNLKEFIRSVKDFPEQGIDFKDIAPLLANPDAFRFVVEQIVEKWKHSDIDRIGAFDARGFLFGTVAAYEMGIPFFPIRKKGKLPFETVEASYDLEYGKNVVEVHTDALFPGENILLIDDVLATGGTAAAGAKLVKSLGGNVAGMQFVIELEALEGRNKLNGHSIDSLLIY